MHAASSVEHTVPQSWYKHGVGFLILEMAAAIAVSAYSLYMTFHGIGGFPGKH